MRKCETILDAMELQRRYREKPSALGDACLTPFVPTCAVALRTTHGKNNIRKCDTEGFTHVASLIA